MTRSAHPRSDVTNRPRIAAALYAAKGGVGTSVTAAALSVLLAEQGPTVLIDLRGDQSHIFGSDPSAGSLSDWLRSDMPHPDSLARLERTVASNLALLSVEARGCLPRPDRMRALAQVISSESRHVVVDLGRLGQAGVPIAQAVDRSYLVTRPCYLALRAAMVGPRPDGVILVSERGRPLRRPDVEAALGVPVAVELWTDPRVARSVDAGLLGSRLPKTLRPLEVLL